MYFHSPSISVHDTLPVDKYCALLFHDYFAVTSPQPDVVVYTSRPIRLQSRAGVWGVTAGQAQLTQEFSAAWNAQIALLIHSMKNKQTNNIPKLVQKSTELNMLNQNGSNTSMWTVTPLLYTYDIPFWQITQFHFYFFNYSLFLMTRHSQVLFQRGLVPDGSRRGLWVSQKELVKDMERRFYITGERIHTILHTIMEEFYGRPHPYFIIIFYDRRFMISDRIS